MVRRNNVAPYGSWASPITTDLIVSKTVTLMEVSVVGNYAYWIEMRPDEKGRYVVVQAGKNGRLRDVHPSPFNARTRVHEYGGGSYAVDQDIVYFSNFSDQRIYRQSPGRAPEQLTKNSQYRYADGVVDRGCRRLICVREDHTIEDHQPVNSVVGIPLEGVPAEEDTVLVQGADFYSSPRLSHDGRRLAWISWNHPNMPWDGNELWVAEVDAIGGTPRDRVLVAGGNTESILQPQWAPDGTLYFISDRSGWWNLYGYHNNQVKCILEMEAEFGSPPWMFGDSSYAFDSASRLICSYKREGIDHLASFDMLTGKLKEIETPYTSISCVRSGFGHVVFIGASPTEFASVVALNLKTKGLTVFRRSSAVEMDAGYISVPEAIEFPTDGGVTAYGLFYRPKNRDYVGPPDERSPLLVLSHGGPTAASDTALKLPIQYWTSRGIAVLDVNYGGSSGYGRAYRQRLNSQWGVVDVNDCINGARHLADKELVDRNRLVIRGGSAGGYTTLAALTFRNFFRAGASYFGLSDLEAFVKDTHKFESCYLNRLVGPYPERADLYKERSPINAVDQFSCPVIFFQGLEDRIVPPNQAEEMVEALRKKGLPVAYVAFEGEQHGFRQAETIKRSLEAELYFYSRVLGFDLAEPIEPVQIANL